MRVTVDFRDPRLDPVAFVSERFHYYLIREKVEPRTPLRDRDSMAWRIDIYDALEYGTLAEARRRPYLYTEDMWPEDAGRELKAQQGLYRVQQALEACFAQQGSYPLRLLGEDNRRDELIVGDHLAERYPPCGFADRPMRSVEFGEKSSGDFSYYSFDADADGEPESYQLLLHGKVAEHFLFDGHDSILILGSGYRGEQPALAREFAAWWERQEGERLQPGSGLPDGWEQQESAEASEAAAQ